MSKTSVGRYFENIAEGYLRRLNYKILKHNYYGKFGELDLITIFNEEIIFIEVKSVNVQSDYTIYQSLSKKKLRRVDKTAQLWMRENKMENSIYRIEFIGIISYSNKYLIEHFKYLEL